MTDESWLLACLACGCIGYAAGYSTVSHELKLERSGPNGKGSPKWYIVHLIETIAIPECENFTYHSKQEYKVMLNVVKRKLIDIVKQANGDYT
jgi:hypothetical protein